MPVGVAGAPMWGFEGKRGRRQLFRRQMQGKRQKQGGFGEDALGSDFSQ